MSRFLRLSSRTPAEAAMDEYFERIGLWRKMIPKDGKSLFRIMSEKIYLTQKTKNDNLAEIDLRCLEIRALAITFKFDFQVYRSAGRSPEPLSSYGFSEIIYLCSIDSKHFDLVLKQKQVADFSICQSILYEIIYENIMGMKNTVSRSDEMISTKVLNYSDKNYWQSPSTSTASTLPIPFPYKVAKSLSADCIRNVEYDVWLESKRVDPLYLRRYSPSYFPQQNSNAPLSPGDKCQVTLPGHQNEVFNAYVQEIHVDNGMANIFVEGIGEKHLVQLSALKLISKLDENNISWKKRGRRKINEGLVNGRPFAEGESNPAMRKMRIHSSGFASSSEFDCDQVNATHTMSDIISYQSNHRIRAQSEGHCIGSLHRGSLVEEEETNNGDDEAFVDGNTDHLTRNFYGMNIQDHNLNYNSNMMPSSDLVSLADQSVASLPMEGANQQMMMEQSRSNCMVVPYQNFQWMSVGENMVAGPINYGAQISVDQLGGDIPFEDMNTIRFFYNLGIQNYRASLLQQQQAPCIYLPPGTPLVMSDMFVMQDAEVASNGSYVCSSEISPTSSAFYFPSPSAPLPQYFHINAPMPF